MDSVLAMVSGNGLERGIRNRLTTFTVDSKGHRGELVVQVDGKFYYLLSFFLEIIVLFIVGMLRIKI